MRHLVGGSARTYRPGRQPSTRKSRRSAAATRLSRRSRLVPSRRTTSRSTSPSGGRCKHPYRSTRRVPHICRCSVDSGSSHLASHGFRCSSERSSLISRGYRYLVGLSATLSHLYPKKAITLFDRFEARHVERNRLRGVYFPAISRLIAANSKHLVNDTTKAVRHHEYAAAMFALPGRRRHTRRLPGKGLPGQLSQCPRASTLQAPLSNPARRWRLEPRRCGSGVPAAGRCGRVGRAQEGRHPIHQSRRGRSRQADASPRSTVPAW